MAWKWAKWGHDSRMIAGIVFYAVSLEETFLHPDDPMEHVVAALFVVAIGLYMLAQAVAVWRCWRTYLYERVIGVVAIALLVTLWDGAARDVVLVSTTILIATGDSGPGSGATSPTPRPPPSDLHSGAG